MQKERNIELAELVKILVALFPDQHPRCVTWLHALKSGGAMPMRPIQSSARSTTKQKPFVNNRAPISPQSPRVEHVLTTSDSSTTASQSTRKVPPLPSYCKELAITVTEWRDKHAGIEISWDKEVDRRDEIASKAGLQNWKEGWNATMPSLMVDVELSSQESASVEVVIPRTVDLQSVLIGVGRKGMPKRFFEIATDEVTHDRIREIGTYVLGTEARR